MSPIKFKHAKEKKKKDKSGLSDSVREELDAMQAPELNKTVADAEQAIFTAKKERDDNEEYQKAKQAVKDLSGSFRDLKKYQYSKIKYALKRLQVLSGDASADELDD